SKDYRLKYFTRPSSRVKGANACRNLGFEMSHGDYIQWFDSDDLMDPKFLEAKIRGIQLYKLDFILSKTLNFKDPDPEDIINCNERYYRFKDYKITNYNYVIQRINWLTCDCLIKREVVDKIK